MKRLHVFLAFTAKFPVSQQTIVSHTITYKCGKKTYMARRNPVRSSDRRLGLQNTLPLGSIQGLHGYDSTFCNTRPRCQAFRVSSLIFRWCSLLREPPHKLAPRFLPCQWWWGHHKGLRTESTPHPNGRFQNPERLAGGVVCMLD